MDIPSRSDQGNNEALRRIFFVAFGVFLVGIFLVLLRNHFDLVRNPYSAEYREGAIVQTTALLVKGQNPYLMSRMPVSANVYGLGYHWVVYPFAKLFGATLFVHRAVTAFSLLMSCALLFFLMRREAIGMFYTGAAVLIVYATSLFYTTPLARPDGLGSFLFLLSIFIPYLGRFSVRTLILSVLLALAGFVTKPYFVSGAFFIGTYLFLSVSKKKAAYYALFFLLSLLACAAVMNALFETYFLNTIFTHLNFWDNNVKHLYEQIRVFSYVNVGLLVIIIGYAVVNVRQAFFERGPRPQGKGSSLIDMAEFDRPFVTQSIPFVLYCLLLACILTYGRAGRHGGNYMVYLYQIITPFLVFYIGLLTKQVAQMKGVPRWVTRYAYILLIPGMAFTVWRSYEALPVNQKCDLAGWQKIEALVASHKNILNSPAIVPLLLEYNRPLYNNGQTEYFRYAYFKRNCEKVLQPFLPADDIIRKRYSDHKLMIEQALARKEFDLVVSTRFMLYSLDTLRKYYKQIDSVVLDMPQGRQQWDTSIWAPKDAADNGPEAGLANEAKAVEATHYR